MAPKVRIDHICISVQDSKHLSKTSSSLQIMNRKTLAAPGVLLKK